jgi:ABC-2 type transport system ATP-binding protein
MTAIAPGADPETGSSHGAVVEVRDLTKAFPRRRTLVEIAMAPFERAGHVTSVEGVSFDVGRGEFFGLLGPNGAGKTTLLRMVATLLTPDRGDVWVDGHHAASENHLVRGLVAPVMANERSLYWRLTAKANLDLFAVLSGLPRADREGRVAEALHVVGLSDTGAKLAGQFSSGMMQRLLIARALLGNPRVLLLDEPTRSLDPVSARDFRRFLREELVRRRDCAVILATHSTEEAFELCDRVVVLNRGRIVATGDPNTLARELAPDRYMVWTSTPRHPVLDPYRAPASTDVLASRARVSSTGSTPVVLQIPGGEGEAAALLRRAIIEGCGVSAFERLPLSLAELIETATTQERVTA